METSRVTRILIIHPVEATRRSITETLRQATRTPNTVHEAGSLTEGLRAARWFDPQYVLLDLSEERSLALEVAREIRRPDRLIIGLYNPLLLREREDDFFRAAARSGVGDFVPVPASEAELAAAFEAVAPRENLAGASGKTVTFFSPGGGVGTTTLAVNAALVLAGSGQAGEVALCDAASQFGDAAELLGMAPDRDLADMVRDLDEIKALSTYLSPHPGTGLRILARPRDLAEAEKITPEQLSRVIIRLERRFDYVVVDTPSVLDLMTMALFDLSEKIYVTTEATTPAVVGTARFLRLLQDQGFASERIRLIVSRYDSFEGNLPPGTVAQQLDRPVDFVVAYDRSLVTAAHRGQPLVLSRNKSEFPTTISQITDDVARPVVSLANVATAR